MKKQAGEPKTNDKAQTNGQRRSPKKQAQITEQPAPSGSPRAPKKKKTASDEAAVSRTRSVTEKLAGILPGERKKSKKKSEYDRAVDEMKPKLKIIPLGGLNEIGKNMTVLEYGDDIMLIDAGIAFPDDEMLGIDLVIPDFSYLTKNASKFRGVVLTHGHEDHIGALPYLLRQFKVPVYGTRLTLGLVRYRLEEHRILNSCKLNTVVPGQKVKLGCFEVEFIRSNHSIPDAVMLAIRTPVGNIIHTGDFKIDTTPISGEMVDLARLGDYAREGVLALMADSTNADRPGMSMSERKVGEAFDALFKKSDSRIIIATFSSNVHRIQQILDAAERYGRKVAISGRSMENTFKVATELGVVKAKDGLVVSLDAIKNLPKDKIVVITTGSQGEPMSALYRMAFSDHRKVEIMPGDMVILSATPIPGNEKLVSRVVNELIKLKAEVVYKSLAGVHVSGHACQEEQKLMLALIKPKFFIPVHGEYRHLRAHADLAESVGMESKNILIPDIGRVIELTENSARFNGTVPSGRVLIDGLGVGDVGNIVLRDRKHLAQDGLIVVVATIDSMGNLAAGPDIVSRGFVYVRESEKLMDEIQHVAEQSLQRCRENHITEWGTLKTNLRDDLADYLFNKTRRQPMILPVIMEV
ncbi:ribonuclease J [Clostridiales bacterium BX7]|uniref:Ribonuclease J n=1 Tax=Feifania hominis TaxID=2763660 RepID=A0A926DG05_9FIRM|nr:ribonuclease J [Feifania hominis]